MKKQDLIEAFTMRLEGKSFEAIANKFGVSKQYIHQSFSMAVRTGYKHENRCKFAGIRSWMICNGVAFTDLCDHVAVATGKHPATIGKNLRGETDMNQETIKAILAVTGLTFEEAFREDDEQREE